MLELVIVTQTVIIVALAGFMMNQYGRLFRAAMSRTPGEYRAAEKETTRKAPTSPKNLVDLDEATQLVLESVTAGSSPMPHGLGGD